MKHTLNTLLVAAAVAAVSHTTWAGPTAQADGTMPMRTSMHSNHGDTRDAMHAKRSAALKAKLKLSPEQEAQWSAFEQSMKRPDPHARPDIDHAALATLTTPERLDKLKAMRAEHTAARATDMERRDNAVRSLYSTLTPQQQKVFDTEFTRMDKRHDARAHSH